MLRPLPSPTSSPLVFRALLPLLAAATLASTAARADTVIIVHDHEHYRDHGRNLLLINPGDLLGGVVSLEYERAITSWFGLTGGLSFWAYRGLFSPSSDPAYTAVSPEFGARFHFIRAAPGGLWVGPYVSAGYVISRSDGSVSRAWSWGLGAALGYNFIIGRYFTFQLGVGGGFVDYGDRLLWAPRLKLGLGFVF